MSDEADNRPEDVWIEVDVQTKSVPEKYYSTMYFAAFSPHSWTGGMGVTGCRFNLTAYVRDMIAEAVK